MRKAQVGPPGHMLIEEVEKRKMEVEKLFAIMEAPYPRLTATMIPTCQN